jgi:hypothetical protein
VSDPALIPTVLLILFSAALASGALIVLLAMRWRRRELLRGTARVRIARPQDVEPNGVAFSCFPPAWVAIRCRNLRTVQSALGLSNPRPCTFLNGLALEHKLFIAPPVNGWILVTGSGLPDVAEDVDLAFRFLASLSRKVGHVQYFNANRVLGHHAWVRAESGKVVRAYAWAGRTLWNQGFKTRAERDLDLQCFDYFESPGENAFGTGSDAPLLNTERVPALAARWSLDPSTIDERILEHTCGIASESPPRLY